MGNVKKIPSCIRREQILDAACELFAEFGYSGATTRQLAEKVGCSETIIFRIFPSKEAIYETLFNEWREADIGPEILPIVDGSARKTLEKFVVSILKMENLSAGQLVRTGWRRQDLGKAVASRRGEEKWRKAYQDVLRQSNDVVRVTLAPVIRFGQQTGEIKDGDPELLAELLWGMVFGLASIKKSYPDRYMDPPFSEIAALFSPR